MRYPTHLRHGEDFFFYFDLLANGCRAVAIPDATYLYTTRVGFISNKPSELSKTKNDFLAIARSSAS